MKFAIPLAEGKLTAHFGHCQEFALIEVEQDEITNKEVIIFGFTNEPFEVDQSKWFYKEMVIKNSKVQSIDDLRAVVRLLEQGKIQTRSFITDVMTFAEYDKAVERVYNKEAIKILLTWEG